MATAGPYAADYCDMVRVAGVTAVDDLLSQCKFCSCRVYRCTWKANSVAVKIIRNRTAATNQTEVARIQQLKHPHLVNVLMAFSGSPAIEVMELCAMSLHQCLHETSPRVTLPVLVLVRFCLELTSALAYIHAQGLCHRKITSTTSFLHGEVSCPSSLGAKLGGPEQSTTATTLSSVVSVGSEGIGYMAPEVMEEAECHWTCADVFSVAVLMHELLSGKEPYAGVAFSALVLRVLHGEHPDEQRLSGHPATLAIGQLLVQCWDLKAQQRPSSKSVEEQVRQIFTEFGQCQMNNSSKALQQSPGMINCFAFILNVCS